MRGCRWVGLLSVVLVAAGCVDRPGGGEASAPTTQSPARLLNGATSDTTRPTAALAGHSLLRPTGVWFIDESRGWVIGEGPCPDGVCLLRTGDGGRHWAPSPAPTTGGYSHSRGPDSYVSDVRFADANNGWAFDRDLWSTHDGGATWARVPLESPVFSLETNGDKVYALVASCRLRWLECHGPVRLYEAEVGSDDWRSVLTVDVGSAGPNGQIVVAGRSVYVTVHPHLSASDFPGDQPVLYAVTEAGDLQRRAVPSPCGVRAFLAAAGPRDLSLWCQTGDGAGGSAPHILYRSRNGGRTWTRIWERRSAYYGPVAITPEGTFLGVSTANLRVDRPDGTQETIRFSASGLYNEQIHSLGFVTPRQGAVVTGPFEGWLYITRDAGHTWEPVNFGS